MPRLPSMVGTTVAVMGLGKSGLSAARALAHAGATVWAWDDNAATRAGFQADGVTLVDLAQADLGQARMVLWSPGIAHTHPQPHPVAQRARALGVPLLCDVELLVLACPEARFVGITGTNGKSTTTALTAHLLAVAGFKMTGRRVFRMAPLHHHFEQLGWEESKIVIRFWIIAVILAIAGLATLKLR